MMLWTKNRIINEITHINEMLSLKFMDIIDVLEELDQEKTYVCCMEESSQEELDDIKEMFQLTAKRMKWTLPKIIFTNTKIKERGKK